MSSDTRRTCVLGPCQPIEATIHYPSRIGRLTPNPYGMIGIIGTRPASCIHIMVTDPNHH